MSYCQDCADYRKRIAELEAENGRLSWRPITDTDLPQVGDEVLAERGIVDTVTNPVTARQWTKWAYTHFRPINVPK